VRQKAPVFAVNGFALLGFKNNELSLTGAAVTPSAAPVAEASRLVVEGDICIGARPPYGM